MPGGPERATLVGYESTVLEVIAEPAERVQSPRWQAGRCPVISGGDWSGGLPAPAGCSSALSDLVVP